MAVIQRFFKSLAAVVGGLVQRIRIPIISEIFHGLQCHGKCFLSSNLPSKFSGMEKVVEESGGEV